MKHHFLFRLFAGLLLLALVAGLGSMAYNAGLAHGMALGVSSAGEDGRMALRSLYGMPGPFMGIGWMNPFGCLTPLLLGGLFLLALGALHGGRPHAWHHLHQAGSEKWEEYCPPKFAEWYRRTHEPEKPPAPAAAPEPETKAE